MKQIDYLRLVATGRKSIHYARPSDADDALTGLMGICFVLTLVLIFGAAVLASLLGEPVEAEMLGWPLAVTVMLGVAYFVCGLFLAGAPKLTRYGILTAGTTAMVLLILTWLTGATDGWYLFIPPFVFALLVSIGAVKQL